MGLPPMETTMQKAPRWGRKNSKQPLRPPRSQKPPNGHPKRKTRTRPYTHKYYRKRYQNKALPANLVLKTWSGTLQNKHRLPENWPTANGVSVGIANHPTQNQATSRRSGIG